MSNDFGKEVLELCDELRRSHRSLAEVQIDYDIEQIQKAIQVLQARHEAELAKAQGEWVEYKPEAFFMDMGEVVRVHTRADKVEVRRVNEDILSKWEDVIHYFERTEHAVPAPPPIQSEPEIEVPDLLFYAGFDFDDYATLNREHKAAMREQALQYEKQIAELKARIPQ